MRLGACGSFNDGVTLGIIKTEEDESLGVDVVRLVTPVMMVAIGETQTEEMGAPQVT